jgi:DHA1 family multidrug resistance protein-like MFS transporter
MAVNWRRNLYALFAAQMLAIVAFSLRAPFLPFYLSDLGAESTAAQTLWSGIINAGGAGVMAITAPFWGAIADRYGRKPMLVRAMVAAVITIALMSLATEVWHLLALRLIEGALTGTVTAATALVAAGTPKDRLGYGLGLIQTAVFSGASLGPLAGGFLGDQIGYRATFWIASAMMAAAAAIVIFLVREQFTPQQRVTTKGRGGFGVWSLVTGRVLLTMIIAMTVIRLASSAVQPIMPLFVEQLANAASGTASTLSGITLGIAGVTSAISAIVLGRLGDRAGHRRILFWSTLAAGLLYFPMAAAQAPWHLIVLQALFGFAAGGLIPAANAMIANHTPADRRGAVYGMVAAAQSAGGFIGPLAGSIIAASLGFPIALSVTGALLLGLAAGLAYSGRADRSNAPTPATASHPQQD